MTRASGLLFAASISLACAHSAAVSPAPTAPPSTAPRVPDMGSPAVEEESVAVNRCRRMQEGEKIRVSIPSPYEVADLANLAATLSCKRIVFASRKQHQSHAAPASSACSSPSGEGCGDVVDGGDVVAWVEKKLGPMGMTAIVREDEVIFVEGTSLNPGPEPTGAERVVLDPSSPLPAKPVSEDGNAQRQAAVEEAMRARIEARMQARAAIEHREAQVSCRGSTCTIDTAGIAPLLDDRSLRVRLLPNASVSGGLKMYGVGRGSLFVLVGIVNGFTLVTIDGKPAIDALGSDAAEALQALLEHLLSSGRTATLELQDAEGNASSLDLVFG